MLPPQDPLGALVAGSVPPGRRFCSGCDQPLGPERGQCPRCGLAFSFVPQLSPGERVADRYEVKGTLAFGGLGWIYLALDVVLGRWVVLKGVLNTSDPRLLAVAAQEREHLAALRHPQIVALHDVLRHGAGGFLVMEYVNGRSLAALRRDGPMPPADALGYLIEALPAVEHLAARGLVHCDIKPDNLMVEEDTMRLIDLGAVRHVDQVDGDVYGSRGYSAPEAADRPSPRSDVYSAGRTLAVLVASFEHQGAHEQSLPPADECDLWGQHPPLFALLRRATALDPEARFRSATELREQAAGVRRLIAGAHPALGPEQSRWFALDEGAGDLASPPLPDLRIDEHDEGASLATAALALPDIDQRRDALTLGLRRHPRSEALRHGLLAQHLARRERDEFTRRLGELSEPWQQAWWRGRWALATGRAADALTAFREVVAHLPGELSPRLGEAWALEATGQLGEAAAVLAMLVRAQPSLDVASLGLARVQRQRGDLAASAAALEAVPRGSRHHEAARHELVATLLDMASIDQTLRAAEVVAALGPDDSLERAVLRAEVLAAAARQAGAGEVRGGAVLGVPFAARPLRLAASQAFERAAGRTREPGLRAVLLEEAARLRPWTWL